MSQPTQVLPIRVGESVKALIAANVDAVEAQLLEAGRECAEHVAIDGQHDNRPFARLSCLRGQVLALKDLLSIL